MAWGRIATLVLSGVLLVFIGFELVLLAGEPPWSRGQDFLLYTNAARRWLETGVFYLPYQLAGPYLVPEGELANAVLYPPPILTLLVPASFLPWPLWWLTPVTLAVHAIRKLAPRPVALVGMLALLAWPGSLALIWTGNPSMWAAAAALLATVYAWPAPFILLKPTLAPFALIGVRRESWLFGFIALSVLATMWLPFWGDWAEAIRNARTDRGTLLYSLSDVPVMLIAVVAWLGRSRDLVEPVDVDEQVRDA